VTGPVASALGGAGLGANDEGDQNFLNPASLVHLKNMSVGYIYSDGYRAKNEHDRFYGFTIADNSPDVFISGAFSYIDRRRTFDAFNTLNEKYFEVSFARQLVKQFSFGFSIFHLNQEAVGLETFKQTNGRLGLFYNPNPKLGVGFLASNLGSTDNEVISPLRLRDELGIGANYILMKQFRFRGDVYQQTQDNPGGKMRWGAGFESFVDAFLVVRAGYQSDALADRDYMTLGFGLTGPRLKIDYSYQKNVDDNRGGMHSVDFRMPL
jgi:hypothetical protein